MKKREFEEGGACVHTAFCTWTICSALLAAIHETVGRKVVPHDTTEFFVDFRYIIQTKNVATLVS